jgi:uncharacterized protein
MDLLLRPHHGLCIQFYEGKGYNENFTKKMDELIQLVQENPNTQIQLHSDVDVLCQACPNNIVSRCITYEKVKRFDEMVLSYCDLYFGEKISIQDFLHLVKEKILDEGIQPSICSDCEWYYICKK